MSFLVNTKNKPINSVPSSAFSITPAASPGALSEVARGLFVGTGGDVEVVLEEDTSSVVLKNVPSGTFLPINVSAVYSGSTTADDIIGFK